MKKPVKLPTITFEYGNRVIGNAYYDAWFDRAFECLTSGKIDDMAEIVRGLTPAIVSKSKTIESLGVLFNSGFTFHGLAERGRPGQVVNALTDLIQANPGSKASLLYLLGKVHCETGDTKAAGTVYKSAYECGYRCP